MLLDCLDLDHTAAGIEPKEDLSTTGLLARRASNGRLGRGEKVILAWPMTKVAGPDLPEKRAHRYLPSLQDETRERLES
ncbi:MAG: hypothetical protein M3Q46_12680 [Verrucomicrobiota bacterium]|nr:hypothetical protein [Verrucomicrobiota bacterium]